MVTEGRRTPIKQPPFERGLTGTPFHASIDPWLGLPTPGASGRTGTLAAVEAGCYLNGAHRRESPHETQSLDTERVLSGAVSANREPKERASPHLNRSPENRDGNLELSRLVSRHPAGGRTPTGRRRSRLQDPNDPEYVDRNGQCDCASLGPALAKHSGEPEPTNRV